MIEINVLPWSEVNAMMDDEYRQLVVADALGDYAKASSELDKFALDILKKTIQVNGFRSFQSIPPHMAKIQVIKEFKVNDLLAPAIICLWAEKQHEIIESLKEAFQLAKRLQTMIGRTLIREPGGGCERPLTAGDVMLLNAECGTLNAEC